MWWPIWQLILLFQIFQLNLPTGCKSQAAKHEQLNTNQRGKNELIVAVFEQEIPLASSCVSSARDLGLWVAMLLVAIDAPLATAERFMICFSGHSSRESSWLNVQTCISSISGLFFTTEPLGKLIETLLKPKSFLRCFTTCFVWTQIWKLNKETNSGNISTTLRNPPKKPSSET